MYHYFSCKMTAQQRDKESICNFAFEEVYKRGNWHVCMHESDKHLLYVCHFDLKSIPK